MARFRAEIEGSRGPASRLGTPSSGVRAVANGWDSGVKVYGYVGEAHAGENAPQVDRFQVILTGGSNRSIAREVIVAEVIDGRVILDPFGDVAAYAADYAAAVEGR